MWRALLCFSPPSSFSQLFSLAHTYSPPPCILLLTTSFTNPTPADRMYIITTKWVQSLWYVWQYCPLSPSPLIHILMTVWRRQEWPSWTPQKWRTECITELPDFPGMSRAPYLSFMPPAMQHHESQRLNKPAQHKSSWDTCWQSSVLTNLITDMLWGADADHNAEARRQWACMNMDTDRGTLMGRNMVPWVSSIST